MGCVAHLRNSSNQWTHELSMVEIGQVILDNMIFKFRSCICLFCWFVDLEFIVPLENFSLIWRRHHCRWRAANFDLCSVFMVIEKWWFFKVPHLLWHGPSVYNLHLRGPVTLAPNLWRAFGSGAVTTCFNDIGLSLLGLKHPNFRLWGDRSYPLRHRRNSNCLNTLVFVLSIKGTGLSAPL